MKAFLLSVFTILFTFGFSGLNIQAVEPTEAVEAIEVGTDTFQIEELPGVYFEKIPDSEEQEVRAVIDVEGEPVYEEYGAEIIIPEKFLCNGEEYIVTEIKGCNNYIYLWNVSKIIIPSSVKKINARGFSVEGYGPVKFIFDCDFNALESLEFINLNECAIESIVYCSKSDLKAYRNLIKKISRVTFYDTEDNFRSYCGINVAVSGEEDVLPLGFRAEHGYYKVLDADKRTVSLICADYSTNKLEGIYEQPGVVYYNEIPFTVIKVDYAAFFMSKCGIKLPSTIKYLASGCFGQHVTSVDLSKTSVRKINSALFLSYFDTDDTEPEVTSVILSESLRIIKKKAFYNCHKIKNITIPKDVKWMGYKAFYKTCKEYTLLCDELPAGIEKQYMKSSVIYVDEKIKNDTENVLKDKIELGKCRVLTLK